MTGTETGASDRLIQGICYINGISLIAIIDMGETHSFISSECVKRLNMGVSAMNGNMVINNPTNGSVTTSSVCVNCPLKIYGRDFGIDLVYLPLIQLDVSSHVIWRTMSRGRKMPKKNKVPSPSILTTLLQQSIRKDDFERGSTVGIKSNSVKSCEE